MSNQSAERKKVRYYRYGPHVVKVIREREEDYSTEEGFTIVERLEVTRNGNKAALLRGGHSYAPLPRRWREKIREEVEKRGQ